MPKIPDVDSIDNPFLRLWNLGYRRLCSVVPPDAELNARSRLYKRSLIPGKDPRGKAPGRRWPDGKWTGYDFTTYEPSIEDMTIWFSWGASVGVKTGGGLVALDIDTVHKETARELYHLAVDMLGEAPIRFGRRPKSLMLYSLTADMPYDKVVFSTPEEERACVEILGEGRQFVAHGVHPVTGQPYVWDRPLLPRPHLPEITPAQLRAYLDAVEERMPAAQRFTAGSEARVDVVQEKLRAPLEIVSAAVKVLPNRGGDFPDREDFIRVGYAIKAACGPEHEQEAIDLYHQWCGRWDEGYNDPEAVEEEWARMKPPFGIGASWLFDKARMLGGWEGEGALYFEPVPGSEATAPLKAADAALRLVYPDTYDAPETDMRFLVAGLVKERAFFQIVGGPKAGKTMVAAHLSECVGSGSPFGGRACEKGAVLYFSMETPSDVRRRFRAMRAARKRNCNVAIYPRQISLFDPKLPELVVALKAAVEDALGLPVVLIVIDTLRRATPGASEKDDEPMGRAMDMMMAIRDGLGTAVCFVHHSPRSDAARNSGSNRVDGDIEGQLVVTRDDGQPSVVSAMMWREGDGDGDIMSIGVGEHDFGKNGQGVPIRTRYPVECVLKKGPKITPGEREIMAAFAGYQGQWVTREVLEEAADMPLRTIQRHISALIEKGVLKCRGGVKGAKREYLWPDGQEADNADLFQ